MTLINFGNGLGAKIDQELVEPVTVTFFESSFNGCGWCLLLGRNQHEWNEIIILYKNRREGVNIYEMDRKDIRDYRGLLLTGS
jgi:hypothetical protein